MNFAPWGSTPWASPDYLWIGRNVVIGQAIETDTAFPAVYNLIVPVGLATETDSATAANPVRGVDIGQAIETDLAQSFTSLRTVEIGLASETDSALTVTRFVHLEEPGHSRYTCILTGSPDLTIPISTFQARQRSGDPTYLSVTVPDGLSYADDIDDRSTGELAITRSIYDVSGNLLSAKEILRANLETIRADYGSNSSTITLTGHKTVTYSTPDIVSLTGASYKSVTDGSRRYRAKPNNQLKPGDTVEINSESFTVDSITYTVSTTTEQMEVAEA